MSEVRATGEMLEARGIYRRWLNERFNRITLAGLAPDDEPLLLRQIYVPLVLTPERVSESEDEEKLHEKGRFVENWLSHLHRLGAGERRSVLFGGRRRDRLPLLYDDEPLTLFDHAGRQWYPNRTLLVSGEPGSGKTTLTRAVVASLSGRAPDAFNRQFHGHVPIPILLRTVPRRLLGDLSKLVDWWLEQVKAKSGQGYKPEALREFVEHGWAVFLFDGLDELGGAEPRRRFLQALASHRWLRGEGANFAILTGRPSGYEDMDEHLPAGLPLHVAPFSTDQIRDYLTKWFALRPMRVGERENAVEALIERLTRGEARERLLPLARRPAYLASLAFVHGTRGQLPHTRAELYSLLVDAYLEVLDQHKELARPKDDAEEKKREQVRNWSRQDKLQVLSTVAFVAHEGATRREDKRRGRNQDEDRRFSWNRTELIEVVRGAIEFGQDRLRDLEPEDAEELADYYVARTGLLAETQEGVYQFAHLSFQEYLAALYLLDQAGAAENKAEFLEKTLLGDLLERDGWHEVAMLLLAVDGLRTQNTGHRPILARLDLEKDSHFELLVRVLAGEEVKLGDDERRAWVVAWYAATAVTSYFHRLNQAPPRVAAQGLNSVGFFAAWRAVVDAVRSADGLTVRMKRVAVERGRPGMLATGGSVLAEYSVAPLGGDQPEPAVDRISRIGGLLDRPEAAAIGIVLPLLAGRVSEDASEVLLPLYERERSIEPQHEEETLRRLTALWQALEAWAWRQEALVAPHIAATPAAWLFANDFLMDQVLLDAEGPWVEWQRRLVDDWLQLEAAFALHVLDPVASSKAQAFALWEERESQRALSRESLPLSLSMLQPGVLSEILSRVLFEARALSRALARALSLAGTLPRALSVDQVLAGDLTVVRGVALSGAVAADLSLSLSLSLLLSGALSRALALNELSAHRLEESLQLLDGNVWWDAASVELRKQSILLTSLVFAALANVGRVDLPERVTRAELERRFARLRDPEAMAAELGFDDPDERARAVLEHQELLDCRWSPIPLLDALFADESWDELDLTPAHIVECYAARMEELRVEVEVEGKKGKKRSGRRKGKTTG